MASRNLIFIPFFLALFPVWTAAQSPAVDVSLSENPVFTGEQFTLSIEINGSEVRNVALPEIAELPDGLSYLSTTPSRGQSISIVNGQSSFSTSYRYVLTSQSSGRYVIPPFSLTIDGEQYQTAPVELDVLDRASSQAANPNERPDIYAVVELDDETPIVGQQLIASIVVYFRETMEVTSYQPSPTWRTDGFWKELLRNLEQPRAESEIIGNVRYRKATLLRYALFPSRSGTLSLSPFELQLGIRTQQRRNDPFGSLFGGFGSNQQRVTIETEVREVTVNRIDPPARGISINAVGSFDIRRILPLSQVTAGTSIDLVTTISGEGSIPLITKPEYDFPESFETYQPREDMEITRAGTAVSGTKTYTDTFVPRTAGTYTIPATEIAIYNPVSGGYSYRTLPALTLEVTPAAVSNTPVSSTDFTLQPITGLAVWQAGSSRTLFLQPWVLAGLILPVIGLLFALRVRHLKQKLNSDVNFARSRRAWDNAMSILSSARKTMQSGDTKQVYNLLHKALSGFIADRLSLPVAGLSDDELCRQVEANCSDREILRQLKSILDKCATISYAPVGSDEDILADISKTEKLLKQLRPLL